MLIIFDVRDDILDSSQWTGLVVKSPFWDLCGEWRIIPMQHLEPLPTPDEEPTINGKEVIDDDSDGGEHPGSSESSDQSDS